MGEAEVCSGHAIRAKRSVVDYGEIVNNTKILVSVFLEKVPWQALSELRPGRVQIHRGLLEPDRGGLVVYG